jgi:hypothetical protein
MLVRKFILATQVGFTSDSHGAPVACPYSQTVAQENHGIHVAGKLF